MKGVVENGEIIQELKVVRKGKQKVKQKSLKQKNDW